MTYVCCTSLLDQSLPPVLLNMCFVHDAVITCNRTVKESLAGFKLQPEHPRTTNTVAINCY